MDDKNVKKKQHYVPQFYLKNFADDKGNLYSLDVKNKRMCSPKSYSGLGYAHYFYARKTGVPDRISQEIEKWLQGIEDIIARKLPDIIDRILNYDHIGTDDRYILSVFMSMLWLRSPNMRNQLNQMEESMIKKLWSLSAPNRVNEYIRKTKKKMTKEERLKIIEMMEKGSYKLQFSNIQHLKFMTKTLGFDGPGFTNMFFGQKWKIYIAKGEKRFITSDSPVVEWWPFPKTFYGASFLQRNKYFSLTPEIFFELTFPVGSKKAQRKTIFQKEDDVVSLFNILIVAHSNSFAYSKDKQILEGLLEGRKNPGILEKTYYDKFERSWDEARKTGRT